MRALVTAFTIALLGALAPMQIAVADPAKPVSVHIQVIEGTRKGSFEERLLPFKDKLLPGYEGAKLVDEVETEIELGSSVSLEILSKSRVLKVTLVKIEPDGTVHLKVAIDAFKFSAETKHKKKDATVVVAHKSGADTALFLAVTPKILTPGLEKKH